MHDKESDEFTVEKNDSDNILANCSFELIKRHYFNIKQSKILCSTLHQSISSSISLLVVGFSTGIFGIYELPEFTQIHTLSISQNRISSVAINSSGD